MPRSGTGVYTLPVAPFTPNTVIKSADVNSDFSDVSTALTQSLATTGVSTMTGPIKAFAGSQGAPGYAFAAALSTGFFLSGANEISWVAGGIVQAVFESNGTVTWTGTQVYNGGLSITGSVTVGSNLTVSGSLSVTGNAAIGATAAVVNIGQGALVVATTSVDIPGYVVLGEQIATPTSVAASKLAIYAKGDGFSATPVPFFETSALAAIPMMFTGGQCQLTKSGSSLLLLPFGGNRLSVNGVPCVIPDVGVSLPASNSAGVFVYIYAVATAGAVSSLEMSTTAPATQTGTGIKQKTGDATRTLVGAAYTDTGGAWADTNGKLWVLSYFNRRRKSSITYLTVSNATATAVYTEMDSAMRNNFISWLDETTQIVSNLYQSKAGAGGITVYAQNELDGNTPLDSVAIPSQGASEISSGNTTTFISGVTEAATHYAALYAMTPNATTFIASVGASNRDNTHIYVAISG